MTLTALMDALRDSPAFQHKQDIAPMLRDLEAAHGAVPVGDDCAVLADGDGYLLFAIEGFLNGFVARDPDFAGYCGVMVNVSDIYAMGGRPTAVVDALWSAGADQADAIMAGLRRAAGKYQVPVVGGHSNAHNDRAQLSVAIIGRAKRLLTSFDARPGDHLMVACDLRGAYRPAGPGEPDSHNWDASSDAPGERLRGDLELLPLIAERGLCRAAKDISMASFVGTTLMLLECSGVGGHLALNARRCAPGALAEHLPQLRLRAGGARGPPRRGHRPVPPARSGDRRRGPGAPRPPSHPLPGGRSRPVLGSGAHPFYRRARPSIRYSTRA